MPGPEPAVRAVTFDYWNTLVRLTPRSGRDRSIRLAGALETAGVVVEPSVVEGAMAAVRDRHDEHWRANRQYRLAEAVPDLLGLLDVEPEADLERVVTDAWLASGRDAVVEPTEGAVAHVLGELGARGIAIGVVCDAGLIPGTVLRHHLDRLGVTRLIGHWSFSDEVGVYKPHRSIFADAFAGLGVEAAEALHVGDLHRTDVAGALAAGASAVRYRGVHDDPEAPVPSPVPVIDRLGAVLDLV